MAETIRIEIPIETVDKTKPQLNSVAKNFERMEKAAKNADTAAQKASRTTSQFDKQA